MQAVTSTGNTIFAGYRSSTLNGISSRVLGISNNNSFMENGVRCIQNESLLGDVNNDGSVSLLDVLFILNLIMEQNYEAIADLNFDEQINILDLLLVVDIYLEVNG